MGSMAAGQAGPDPVRRTSPRRKLPMARGLPHHHPAAAAGTMAGKGIRRLKWAGVLLFCGLVGLYYAVGRNGERGTLSYAPLRVAAGLDSHGARTPGGCIIPAERLVGRGAGRDGLEGDVHDDDDALPTTVPLSSPAFPRPIPLIATNLDFDTETYLTRFVQGVPAAAATHKLIAWGGCDPFVAVQVDNVLATRPDVSVYRFPETMGCAAGWNVALEYMATHPDIPFAVVFNADMFTPPGSLEAFAQEIWATVDADPTFCVGFFKSRGAGTLGRYTAYVYTRHALQTLGYFDANIYPAYYEDVEMDIRIARAQALGECSAFRAFNSSHFVHGREGRKDKYRSGTKLMQQRMVRYGDAEVKAMAQQLAAKIKRGKLSSPLYLHQKWGCRAEVHTDLASCGFAHPFDDPARALSYWELDEGRRTCLDDASKGESHLCEYTLG